MPDNKSLEMKHVYKSFMGIHALQDVHFDAYPGKVNVLIGENGAGKSTLMKILVGAYTRDEGQILIDGKEVDIHDPFTAKENRVAMIYQELNLEPYMSVADNIFLGKEIHKGPWVNKKVSLQKAKELLDRYDMDIDPAVTVGSLSVAKQQMLEIVKALSENAKIIIMDEPTSSLTQKEVDHLFRIIRQLKEEDITIIYISHRMEELFEIGDYITVMRDGEFVAAHKVSEITENQLITELVGREVTELYPEKTIEPGEVVLKVENLTKTGVYQDVSFDIRKGEIVGFSGLVGAGRTEVALSLFGEMKYDSGTVELNGEKVHFKSPTEAIQHKMAYLPEDRKLLGIDINNRIRDNISIANMDKISSSGGFLNKVKERLLAKEAVSRLNVKASSIEQLVGDLSGGNQQKVVLAKWVIRDMEVLILDEPTRGIDVGAKEEIHKLMVDLAEQGIAIMMISSELPEVIGMSDRIVVMHEGRVRAVLNRSEATQEKIMSYSV